jgi:Fe2+ or Zn2+ uptake regulation protein
MRPLGDPSSSGPQARPAPDSLPLEAALPAGTPKKLLRQTEQRKAVFEALMEQADHPSAVDVFMRVKTRVPSISLATVYNCLVALTDSGVIRAVNHEREPSRFCANLQEHAHLFCTQCGSVTDLPLHSPLIPDHIWALPKGVRISHQQVSFQGLCARCTAPTVPPASESSSDPEPQPISKRRRQ